MWNPGVEVVWSTSTTIPHVPALIVCSILKSLVNVTQTVISTEIVVQITQTLVVETHRIQLLPRRLILIAAAKHDRV